MNMADALPFDVAKFWVPPAYSIEIVGLHVFNSETSSKDNSVHAGGY